MSKLTKRQLAGLQGLAQHYQAEEEAAMNGDPYALYRWRITQMKSKGFAEIAAADFYRELFPEGSFERQGRQDDCRPNGIITRLVKTDADDKRDKGTHRLITDDLDALRDPAGAFGIVRDETTALRHCGRPDANTLPIYICSPVGYSGRRPTNKGAYKAFALTLDLDGVGVVQHRDAIHQMCVSGFSPRPTYIISSGNGLHIYYLFDHPVALYPQAARVLGELKHRLIERVWNGDTSTEKRQFQGLVQGFRVVGQPSKLGADYPVRAWRTGERVSLEYLNDMTRSYHGKDRPVITDFTVFEPLEMRARKTTAPIGEIVSEHNEPSKPWAVKRALYDWFLKLITEDAEPGHRYYCILCLAIIATKCGIERKELERDAYKLLPLFDRRRDAKHGEFFAHEIEDAMKIYGTPEAHKKRRAWIAAKCALIIEGNKRNGRKQAEHLKRARFSQELDYPDGSWREGNGRPVKRDQIAEYRDAHPYASKADCIRETGLSKKTVYKWWDKCIITREQMLAAFEEMKKLPPYQPPSDEPKQ